MTADVSADQLAADVRTIRQAMWLHEEPGTRRREFITAVDRLVARLEAAERERDEAFDEGMESVWSGVICSICGQNHDADEATACEGCEPVTLGEFVRAAGPALAEANQRIAELEAR